MKKTILFVCIICASLSVLAQSSAVSQSKEFNIQKVTVPPILKVVDGSVQFVDPNGNNIIDSNEKCAILMAVKNTGRGDGYGCRVIVKADGTLDGIDVHDQNLGVIKTGETCNIEIPIVAGKNTKDGKIRFSVAVDEPNGFGTLEQSMTIATHAFEAPEIRIVSYKVEGSQAGTLQKSSIFTLKLMLQNTAQGKAENIDFRVQFPENVSWMGGDNESMFLPKLDAGEIHTFEFELAANNRAADQVQIPITLHEKYGMYAQNTEIPLTFGQTISGKEIVVKAKEQEKKQISIGSFVSDVDENIPQTNFKNKNTFVVIIANENYMQVAPVPYAINDGSVFREYCVKTLGVPEQNIHYIKDATGNQLKAQLTWLQNITEVFEDEQVIFYYAGHGIPEESNKTSYLLPVDGSGMDVSTGYKLNDLYASLGSMQVNSITVFMDACFSGSQRGSGMLASARGIALKSKAGVPQGNMVVFSAAQGDETAYPNNEQGHGMFTYYLLKKLQETKGDVTLKDLGDYITTNVSQQSIVLNSKSQTPCVTPASAVADSWQNWKLR